MKSKPYHVKWALVAQIDLQQILDYVALENPGQALQILGNIKQKASALTAMPDRGRIVPELKDQGIPIYREILVPPWRIIYRVSDSTVFVLSVIDSRRNVEDILLNRFVR